jgi:hypothetical protein
LRSESGKKALSGPFNPSGKGNKLLGITQHTMPKEFFLHQPGPPNEAYKWLTTKKQASSFG